MSVCLNHTDRPASQRCKACLRPICEQCVVETEDGIYCSTRCFQDAKKYAERMAALGIEKPPPGLWDFLRGPVLFVGFICFVVACLWLMSPNSAPASIGAWIKLHVYQEKPVKPGKPGKTPSAHPHTLLTPPSRSA